MNITIAIDKPITSVNGSGMTSMIAEIIKITLEITLTCVLKNLSKPSARAIKHIIVEITTTAVYDNDDNGYSLALVIKPSKSRSNIDGSKTKINGIKKPANDSFNAWKHVFIGSPSAIPAPAKAAKATGGVTLAKIPK